MSKPLIGKKDTALAAAQWHKLVFMTYGHVCWIHAAKDPRSKVSAKDAAHIIKRSRMGAALAYRSVRFGRPLCRPCHEQQEAGLDPMFYFPYADVLDAHLAHNEIAKAPLPIPEKWVDAWKKRKA